MLGSVIIPLWKAPFNTGPVIRNMAQLKAANEHSPTKQRYIFIDRNGESWDAISENFFYVKMIT